MSNELVYSLKDDNDENIITDIRLKDGYIHATKLCNSAGKDWYDYIRLKKTKAFLSELSKELKISDNNLIDSKIGGVHEGTWIHPIIATNLAQWCSVKFGIKIGIWIEKAKKNIKEINDEWNYEIHNIKPDEPKILIEKIVRNNISEMENGKIEIQCKYGIVDVVTNYEIIEIKRAEKYKHALGQILSYFCDFPNKIPRVHLFHEDENILNEIINKIKPLFKIYNVKLTYNVIDEDKIIKQNELMNELDKIKQHNLNLINNNLNEEIDITKLYLINNNLNEEIDIKKFNLNKKYNNIFKDEFNKFITDKCEFGEDGHTDKERFRITCDELYDYYLKCVTVPIIHKEFKKIIKEQFNINYKAADWHHETHNTWFGIRLKNYTTQKISKIQKLILEFIDVKCDLGVDYIADTKTFYDKFEEYSIDKGFEIIKRNGFTRQLFRTELFKANTSISVKEWAIEGKKHGFLGIKLKDSPIQLSDITRMFVQDKCRKAPGQRTKSTDIWKEFVEYTEQKCNMVYPKLKFFKEFRNQNEDLTHMYISKSERGYVGIVLHRLYNN
jgi:hypothetical protein